MRHARHPRLLMAAWCHPLDEGIGDWGFGIGFTDKGLGIKVHGLGFLGVGFRGISRAKA